MICTSTSVTKKGGVLPTHRTIEPLVLKSILIYLPASRFPSSPTLCLPMTPAVIHDEPKTPHSQQHNTTDRTPFLASLPLNTHMSQSKEKTFTCLHLQSIYTPRAQALGPFKFTKLHTSQSSSKLSLSFSLPKTSTATIGLKHQVQRNTSGILLRSLDYGSSHNHHSNLTSSCPSSKRSTFKICLPS
jgi:hypothetical protein